MMTAVVDGNGTGTPKREFTSQDFERYAVILKPYQERVMAADTPLPTRDAEYIHGLERELLDTYTPQSLTDLRIFGEIGLVTGRNDLFRNWAWRQRLEREYRELAVRVSSALDPSERERMYARLDEICADLEPEHHLG